MNLEFGIHEIHRVDQFEALLTGRCFKGLIQNGTTFLNAFEVITSDPAVERRFVAEVDLQVTKIEAYGRVVDKLDEGLTAAISVSGKGIEILKPHMSIAACAD